MGMTTRLRILPAQVAIANLNASCGLRSYLFPFWKQIRQNRQVFQRACNAVWLAAILYTSQEPIIINRPFYKIKPSDISKNYPQQAAARLDREFDFWLSTHLFRLWNPSLPNFFLDFTMSFINETSCFWCDAIYRLVKLLETLVHGQPRNSCVHVRNCSR